MMESMKSATRIQHPSTEQLSLLPTSSTPARFRLSRDTRERGLRHVAEIRQMLAARAEGPAVARTQHDQAA
jgi:hypothetical protein